MFSFTYQKYKRLSSSNELILIAFINTVAMSIVYSQFSVYLYEVFMLSKSEIGLLTIFFSVVTLLSSFILGKYLEIFGEKKMFIFSILLLIITFIGFKLSSSLSLVIVLGTLLYLITYIKETAFNILFKDEEPDEVSYEKDEGIVMTLINLGWFVGPLIAGFLLYKIKISDLFLVAVLILFLAILLFLIIKFPKIKKEEQNVNEENNNTPTKNLKSYFKNSQLKHLFILGNSNKFWWAFVYVFFPIIILENGFSASLVGIFLAIVILPLVIVEFPISKYVTKLGFRNVFVTSHIIMILALFGALIFDNIYVEIAFLIFGSFGPALLQPTKDIFFFKNTTKTQEEKYYSIYYSSNNLGGLVGKGALTILFLFTSIDSYAYILIILLMIFGLYSSTKIEA